jgi:hypothetical protein
MANAPEKCRCASKTHGHMPGKCPNLATEPERLCKPCYDKTSAELAREGSATATRRNTRNAPSKSLTKSVLSKPSALAATNS